MLPPGGTEMTTRMVLAACDHAGWSGTALARLAKAEQRSQREKPPHVRLLGWPLEAIAYNFLD